MGQPRRELTPDRSPLHLWGSELRAWRDRRELSLAKMGELIRYNPSYLARIERGERKPPRELAEAADRELNTSGALLRLWELIDSNPNGIRHSNHVANHPDHVANMRQIVAPTSELPAESDEAGVTIPCRTQDGGIIFVTLPRRTFLSGLGLGTMAAVSASPSASAQSRALGSPQAISAPDLKPAEHFRQLRRVLIDNDNLLGPLRAIPTVESQIDAIRQLRLSYRGSDASELLYIQTQYAELCGWLYQDTGDFRSAQFWTDRALEWSYAAGVPDLTTFILARKSQLAGDMRDGVTAIDLATAAARQARPDTRLGAIAATNGAYGYALIGDNRNAHQMLDLAHDLISNQDMDPAFSWGSWMDDAYIEIHRARSLYTVGQYTEAAEGFRTAIENLPAMYHRDRGVYLARESLAYVGAHEPEQAASTGLQALGIGQATGSARIITELTKLDGQLERWHSVPAIAEFREAFDGLIAHQT
ncbi:helix-turn-helix transcriptional regulator [Nonomuraea sp. NBC_00507]|uniref:helix-turn-helix domain-containing protein n=1 Tax=Nonomuraea sp. NBC_00507 TaxID=2976002 RepID=UPI002E189DFE